MTRAPNRATCLRAPPVRRRRLAFAAVLATARTFTLLGVEAREVRVEVDVRQGLPAFALVGLPDAAVRESRERVRAALVNSGLRVPAAADHRQPRAGRPAQGRARASTSRSPPRCSPRPGSCPRRRSTTWRSPASSPSTARCARSPARWRWPRRPRAAGLRAIVVAGARRRRGGARRRRRGWSRSIASSSSASSAATPSRPRKPPPVGAEWQRRGVARPRRPARPARAAARARGRRRRRPQPADHRAAGGRQVDGGAAAALDPAAARSRRGARGRADRERLRPAGRAGARRAATVSRPAPHDLDRGPDRGRQPAAARRGDARPPRRAVPRRAAGVRARPALEALRQPLEDGSVRIVPGAVRGRAAVPVSAVAAANPCPCGRGQRSGDCTCEPAAVRAYEAKLTGALADRIDISARGRAAADPTSFAEPGEGSAGGRASGCSRRASASGRAIAAGAPNAELAAEEIEHRRRRSSALLAAGSRARGGSAAAGASACSGWRGRSPTSTGAERIDVERRRRGAVAAPARGAMSGRTIALESGGRGRRRAIRRRSPTSTAASARRAATASADRRARSRRLDRAPAVTIVGARRRAPTGCGSPSALARDLALAGVDRGQRHGAGDRRAPRTGARSRRRHDARRARQRAGRRLPGRATARLYERIVATGAAISEHPPGDRGAPLSVRRPATGSWPRSARWW